MKRIAWLCLAILVAGCKIQDIAPAPTSPTPLKAEFTVPTTIVETREALLCKNISTGETRVEWRVSNDPSSVYIGANYLFFNSVPGTYTVTLTVFNDRNESAAYTKSIVVGRKYIKEIRLTELNFLQYTGAPWHADGTGPNVSITIDGYQPATDPLYHSPILLYRSPVRPNVQPGQLPISWVLSSAEAVINLTTIAYSFSIMDQYGNTPKKMGGWLDGEGTSQAVNRDATGTGSFVLQDPGNHNTLIVIFQVR